MTNRIMFFRFKDGKEFTLASNVEKYAVSFGAKERIDANGTKHPGSVCNGHLKTILRSNANRRILNLKTDDYCSIDMNDSPDNSKFINWLIKRGYVTRAAIKNDRVDLYTKNAVRVICCYMLKDKDFEVNPEHIAYMDIAGVLQTSQKELQKVRLRPSNSLFKK